MALAGALAAPAWAVNSYWVSTKDETSCIVSAVVQYNRQEEARIRKANGLTESVLIMDINLRNPEDLCRMLVFRQEQEEYRPVLCVTETRGNIYHGYIILPDTFTLTKPITITLGGSETKAVFSP